MISTGTRLGVYEVLAPLGSGGMGEVYRARDRKLGRDVAIKILPEAFALDPERLARFEREAQVLASLNHPHIAQIYGVIEQPPALVMEFVDGEDLAERLTRGRIAIDEALDLAKQIAEALEAAHERGIVHRDLKPANVMVSPSGTVKVLDFGLAKAVDSLLAGRGNDDAAPSLANSPTFTSPGQDVGSGRTHVGAIMGTAAYMSPEQARGRPVDRRTDVWAFGCVLFEMLAGRPLFGGASASDVIAAILKDAPPLAAVPTDTPAPVRRLLRRCLEKDPAKRLDSMAAARLEIEDALSGAEAPTSTRRPTLAIWRLPAAAWVTGLVLISAAAAAWTWGLGSRRVAPPGEGSLRLAIDSGVGGALNAALVPIFALSRDGQTIVFVATPEDGQTRRLFVRHLDQFDAKPLEGTSDASDPFLSPDQRWIGYFAHGKLWKIAVDGGAAVPLADVGEDRGAVWGDDDVILYTPNPNPGGRLMKVPGAGGTPAPLGAMPAGQVTQRWPQILPGGGVIYTSSPTVDDFENACLVAVPPAGGAPKVVQCGGYFWRYVPSGHVLYVHNGTLFAARFDLSTLAVTGAPVPMIPNVRGSAVSGGAQFAVADDGTLAYLQEPANALALVQIIDRRGVATSLPGVPPSSPAATFSPDGKRLAIYSNSQDQGGIWVYDLERAASMRLTRGALTDTAPIWSPDGSRIVFASARGGPPNLFWIPADGSSAPQRLTTAATVQVPSAWSPDGRRIAFSQQTKSGYDIWMLSVDISNGGMAVGSATPWLATDANEILAAFSPDGRYVSYSSNETGTPQVYVRPLAGQARYQISTEGGSWSAWSGHSRELLFGTLDGRIMSVTYTIDATGLHASRPGPWGTAGYTARGNSARFALAPDGAHLATSTETAGGNPDRLHLVTNFLRELQAKLPRH